MYNERSYFNNLRSHSHTQLIRIDIPNDLERALSISSSAMTGTESSKTAIHSGPDRGVI
jgi:hypothetical protein